MKKITRSSPRSAAPATPLSARLKNKLLLCAVLLPIAGLGSFQPVLANTWVGGGAPDPDWSNAANWDVSSPSTGSPLVFDGITQLTTNNDLTAGTVFGGITFNSSAGAFVLNGNSLSPGGDIIDNASNTETINLAVVLTASRNFTSATSGQLTINGAISDGGSGFGFTANGPGTVILGGANTYSGTTAINSGTVVLASGGTLGNGNSALTLGNGTLTSTLDLTSSSANVSTLTVSTNTGTSNSILLGAGRTLTTSGNVVIGGLVANGSTTSLIVSGNAGSFSAGSGTGGVFVVGNQGNANGSTAAATLDLSGVGNVTLNYAGGIIGIGTNATGGSGNASFGTLLLGNNNILTASVLNVGISNGGGNAGFSALRLGTSNVLNIDTILVGQGKTANANGLGTITFNSGLTNPTVTINGSAGNTTRVANFTVADYSALAASSSTGDTSSVDFTAGTVNALINNLTIGIGKATTGAGPTTGNFSFSAGTVDVTNVFLATQGTSTTANANVTANLNVSGTGHLIVGTGGIVLGTKPATPPAAATITGVLNVTGGTVSMGADIVTGGGNGTVTLNGGTLDLQGHNLGIAGKLINTVNLQSGTLKNVAQINAGAAITKTTTGTLVLDGVNTFTGNTTVSAGTLSVIGSMPTTNNIAVSGNATLAGAGNGTTTGILGNVTTAANAIISPGASTGAAGTLTLANLTVNGGNFVYDLGTGISAADRINVTGNATFTGASSFTVGAAATAGVYTLLSATGALTLTITPTIIPLDGSFQYVLDTTSNAHAILLDVNALGTTLVWSGAADHTTWDFSKQNFFNGNNNQAFSGISPVVFDDTAPATTTNINITVAATPATVTVNSNTNNYTLSGTGSITGNGNLTLNGSSTFTINNANTYLGDTIVNAGTIVIGATGSIASGNVTVNSSGTFTVLAGGNIAATTNLTDNGIVNSNNPTRTIATLNGGGTLTLNSTAFTVTAGGNFTGTIQDGASIGSLVVTGGTLTLSGSNTFSGGDAMNGGTLSVSADNNLGNASGPLSFSGGTLLLTGENSPTTNRAITLNAAGGTLNVSDPLNTLTVASSIIGAGGLTKAGPGTLVLSVTSNYVAGTTISGGILSINDDSQLGNSTGPLTLAGGTLMVNGTTDTTTSRTVTVTGAVGGFNIADPGNNFALAQAVTGNGTLGKSGPGTLTLSGANTYSGLTSINVGTVVVTSTGTLGNGLASLSLGSAGNAGALDVTAASGTITVANLMSAGNISTPSTIAIGAGKTLNATGNVLVGGIVANGSSTTLIVTGATSTLNVGAGTPGTFVVGNQANGNSPNTATGTLDLSGLGTFTANYGSGATSIIGIGTGVAGGSGNAPFGTLILAANNTLTAGNLNIGINNGGGNTSLASLVLGTTNVLNIDNITVGSGKSTSTTGSIAFNSGLTNPTVTLRGSAGGSSRVNSFVVSDGSQYNVSSPTASTGNVDFTAGSVDALINNLTIAVGKALINTAPSNGTLSFSAGTINATTITLGIQGNSVTAGAAATGTLNVNGTGNLIAGPGGIILGELAAAPAPAATVTGNLNINGGSVTTSADIIDGGGISNITLNGGTLNLGGHNLGTAASPIDNLSLQSGTLANVAEIDGGTVGVSFSSGGVLALAGTNTYTGPTSVSGGEIDVTGSIASTNVSVGGGSNLVVFTGGTLAIGTNLTDNGNVVLRPNSSSAPATKLASLSLSGGLGAWSSTLDITNNKLIVEDSANHAATLAATKDQVAFGTLNPFGIISSTLTSKQTIAVVDNAIAGKTTFGGDTVDAGSILVDATFKGDANLDGVVNIADLNIVAANWQKSVTDWSQGDFNGDGIVNIADLNIVAANWQAGTGSGSSSSESLGQSLSALPSLSVPSSVPEPASLALLGLGGLLLANRRRRSI